MKTNRRQIEKIQGMVLQMVKENIICGASLGVIEEEQETLWCCGNQGVLLPYCERRLEVAMHYDLASLSKVIGTTTRVLQLLEQKKMNLDTKVKDLLPQFPYEGICVEHLLLHNSGLPAEIRDKGNWTRENILELACTTQPEAEPGERFIYSDVGFIMLGKLIETVDACGLEESYQRHIFGPLAMHHTSFIPPEDKIVCVPTESTEERGCICGEVHDRKGWLLGPCGSAGLFSTLEDVMLFVRHYLRHSDVLFGTSVFELLEQKEQFGRTLGWSREYGSHTLYHTGFTGTSVLMDMEQRRGMVFLTNRIHPTRENTEFLEMRKEINVKFLNNNIPT